MAQTSTGARKLAAQRIGITDHEYRQQLAQGNKWCSGCKAWHACQAFGKDQSRSDGLAASCIDYRRSKQEHSIRTEWPAPGRRFEPARPNDKKQARRRVNHLIDVGLLPRPSTVPCMDCKHLGDDRRHEYDHFLGYAPEHHEKVEVVCSKCHRTRERSRGVQIGRRASNGRP